MAAPRRAGRPGRARGWRLDRPRRGTGPAGGAAAAKRRDLLIRKAYVMTMDPTLGDLADGDILLRDGAIVAVGRGLAAPNAMVIDGRNMIALPGLIETHWHMWNSLLRSMAGDQAARGYFPTTSTLGQAFLPGDMYHGTRLAAAEALNGGITFVHDWCHNIRGPEHADANLRALAETGLRGRFSFAHPAGLPATEPIDLAGLERLHGDWARHANGGLLTLGMGWRGVRTFGVARAPEVYRREADTARRLGIPISVHCNMVRGKSEGEIAALAEAGLLGRDVQVIHATHVTPERDQEPGRRRRAGQPVALHRAAHRLRLAADGRAAGRRHSGRPVGRHHGAVGQRRHVRDHEGDPECREWSRRERVRAAAAARARARDPGGRAQHGHRRPGRLAQAGQARRSDPGRARRRQYRAAHRSRASLGRGGAAGQRLHGGGRRPHPEARAPADRARSAPDRARSRRGALPRSAGAANWS
ncbi:MAG: amidohydrolase family protein [Pseudomonadota bacterium]